MIRIFTAIDDSDADAATADAASDVISQVVNGQRGRGNSREAAQRVHASCVAVDGRGALLLGPSGSGKSMLALRLIDAGAALIADDQTLLSRRGDRVWARAPGGLRGRLEVRGLGLVELGAVEAAALVAVFHLRAAAPSAEERARARLPDPVFDRCCGIDLRRFEIDPDHAGAAAFVRVALRAVDGELFRHSVADYRET